MSLSTITDAYNGLERLTAVFLADEISGTFKVDYDSEYAIQVNDADFVWESTPPAELALPTKKEQSAIKIAAKAQKKLERSSPEPESSTIEPPTPAEEVEVLQLSKIDFKVKRGDLVAIVGPVGSGKSSLLQALIGEMRRTKGEVIFGGSLSYCPQQSWIRNATLRENILFGQDFDEAKYQKVIRDACLGDDLAMLPNGDETEIGSSNSPQSSCSHL